MSWPAPSLFDRLGGRATSDRPAFTHLTYPAGDDPRPHTLSWAALSGAVSAVSARLRPTIQRGDRVAVLAGHDLGYVVGFLAALHAGAIAVPLFEPEVSAHRDRLVGALVDSAPRVWLTSPAAERRVREFAKTQPVPSPERLLVANPDERAAPAEPVVAGPDEPAYLQYTSGSTREPAGVVVTHGALAVSCRQVSTAYEVTESTTCAGWIPFFHDMGLIQLLCVPVHSGARSVFFPPLEFVRRPVRWLRQLAAYPEVFTAAPNFAFDLAVEATEPADRAGLDLSGVRIALNGSEPVRADTVARFAETFAPHGFSPSAHRPSYGLAEATVLVSAAGREGPVVAGFAADALAEGRAVRASATAPGTRRLVSAGHPVEQLVRIVDADGRIAPDGSLGEVWVHGPHVAAGYWRQPERTRETFEARLAAAPEGVPAGGWLRTGDLGVVDAGELYLVGRLKDLIVVDGRNHYPQDLEATVAEAHPAIRRGRVAAFAVDGRDGEGVVVVAEHRKDLAGADPERVAADVRRAVADRHDLALHGFRLLAPGQLPRTSSGKVARTAARTRCWEGR